MLVKGAQANEVQYIPCNMHKVRFCCVYCGLAPFDFTYTIQDALLIPAQS